MKITGKRKRTNGYLNLRTMCYQPLSLMLDMQKLEYVEELTGFAMKKGLTLPSLANKYFNSLRD